MDRKKRFTKKDWRVMHYEFIQLRENRVWQLINAGPPHDQHTFDEYLRWLHRSTRTHIRPPTLRT
jgi:hypothetical protein